MPAVEESTGSKTIADMMAAAAGKFGDHAAVKYKRDGTWHDVSFAEVGEIVSEIARGLIDLGIEPGDKVSILAHTRPEWTHACFGILTAGGTLVTIYQTNSPEECQYVLEHSEAVAVFVDPWIGRRQIAAFSPSVSPSSCWPGPRPSRSRGGGTSAPSAWW